VICPGCSASVGLFATADTGELTETIRCRVTGAKYLLQQNVPRHPPMPGAKLLKRGKRRRAGVDVEVLVTQQPRRRQSVRPAHRPLRRADLAS
jgi:hypothetical protein